MKLSEAILLGSIGSEQGFGAMSAYKGSVNKCAIGAALLAVSQEVTILPAMRLVELWPWTGKRIPCPDGVSPFRPRVHETEVYNVIWQLNDQLRWTRPQIAAWVASIEPDESQEGGIADNINLAEHANSTPGLTSLGVECQG